MSLILDNMQRFRGYRVSDDVLGESDFSEEVETTASPATETLVATTELTNDQFKRPGQGEYEGEEYTKGEATIVLDDGSGNAPHDQSTVEIVTVSGNNNVQDVVKSAKYAQWKNGMTLSEEGMPIVSHPKDLGLRVQSGSGSSYTVSLADSNIAIDAKEGEQ